MPRRQSNRPARRQNAVPPLSAAPEASQPPRIIGGELKGKRLPFTPDGRTRPMKDRVREVLFDLVGPAVKDTLAIDLFAGSGALGFEAISRGAVAAVLAERHFPTADQLKRTAATLGIAESVDVRPGDVLLWARRMPGLDASRPWVVFFSPPWAMFRERTAELMALIEAFLQAAPPGSQLVVEADDSYDPASLPLAEQWTCRPLPPAMLYVLHVEPAVKTDLA
jgi:16S rRNA (guanine966-N2)-methyltransferase